MTSAKISDYSLIGNSRAAALVSKAGSIDWCCLPEFDSPAIFAALLDREEGGHFSITPVDDYQSAQKYITDTNVLETDFETAQGKARLLDAFTVMTEAQKEETLFPEHEILRVLEGISGTVHFILSYSPRTYYGKNAALLENRKKQGIHFSWKEQAYTLLSTLEHEQIRIEKDQNKLSAILEFSVKAGERVIFSLSYSSQSPAVLPDLKTKGWKRMENSISYWKNWIKKCKYTGLYLEYVKRSVLVLKLLSHAPSGAIIAAPTTSLPEQLGGVRNWDYRYCWLRDASFTVRVFLILGFEEEVHAYMGWILHATRLTRPKLQVVYTIFGHASLKEKQLKWLKGFENSRPVNIGNGADKQFQLDLYGEVLDGVYTYSGLINQFDRSTRKFILGLGEAICKLWDQPDNGIWEVRSARIHHTHSKVMAWVGLNRLIKLIVKYQWNEAPVEKYRQLTAQIAAEVERFGYNNKLGAYTRELNGDTLDASLLTLSLVGYCDASSDRMIGTCDLIYESLCKNDLIYRYRNTEDSLRGSEGSFAVCNFWLVENMAKSGKLEKAVSIFETMLKHASPTGLWSEEIDPNTHELLGNYPQGFTHIGLINAALTINEVYQKGETIQ